MKMTWWKLVVPALPVAMLLQANDVCTQGQFRFGELCRATEDQLAASGECSPEFFERQVKPLLMESILHGEIWDNTLKIPAVPSFNSFLIPEIGTRPNPFFRDALTTFLASDRFRYGGLAFRRESCFELVRMLCRNEYAEFHPFITRMLFRYFHAPEYYDEAAQRWLAEMLEKRDLSGDPKVVLLLLFLPPEVYFHWRVQVVRSYPDWLEDVDSGKLLPWLMLVLAARNEPRVYGEKLEQALKGIDHSAKGVARAIAWFPWLSLIRTPEMVRLLEEYVKDGTTIDPGDDVVHRNIGLAFLAACNLYVMLEGFPEFPLREFSPADRKKCLDWLERTKTYCFRAPDYWTFEPIVARIRYLMFER